MSSEKIVAGIVLYNPQIERLIENIAAIGPQVDQIVLIDNGSKNSDEIVDALTSTHAKCHYIDLHENKGIAYALNVILRYASDNSYHWFLTLDQDSVSSATLIQTYQKYLDKNVGILSCNIVDRNFHERSIGEGLQEIDFAITSGSLNNVEACLAVNGFDYGMFIDFVDFDICAKLRAKGYKILRIYDTSILHELGDSRPVRILGKQYIVYNHSPLRLYYFYRNCEYFIQKHKDTGTVNKRAWKKNMLRHFILITIYEKKKNQKYRMILQGLCDVKKMPSCELGYNEMEYNNVLF